LLACFGAKNYFLADFFLADFFAGAFLAAFFAFFAIELLLHDVRCSGEEGRTARIPAHCFPYTGRHRMCQDNSAEK